MLDGPVQEYARRLQLFHALTNDSKHQADATKAYLPLQKQDARPTAACLRQSGRAANSGAFAASHSAEARDQRTGRPL
jgi:hypothetical protein